MRSDSTRREFLKKCFQLGGMAAIYGMGAGAVKDAHGWGIFPSLITSGGGTACSASCLAGNDTDTVLLIHSNTTDGSTTFIDSGKNAACPHAPFTVSGSVQHSTDYLFTCFGTTSIKFVGDGCLNLPDSASWDLDGVDFCVELKWNFGATINNGGLIGRYVNEANTWGLQYGSNVLYWYHAGGTTYDFAWTPAINTAYHIAITRISGTLRAFINGLQIGADQADATNYGTAGALSIGNYTANPAAGQLATGYMTEVAIHNGDGVYPAGGFTPNTGAYCD